MAVFLHHGLGHAHLHVGTWRAQDAALEEIRAELLAHHMDGDEIELQLLELVVLLRRNRRGVTLPMPVLFSLSWIILCAPHFRLHEFRKPLHFSASFMVEAARLLRDIRDDVLDLGEGEHGLERVLAPEAAGLGAAKGRARWEQIVAIDPDAPGLDLPRGAMRASEIFASRCRRQGRNRDRFAESQHRVFARPGLERDDRAEDLLAAR